MEKVDINNIADGALAERFERALDEVLKNIIDPNSSITKTREIVMRVKVKPSKDRNSATFGVSVEAKLANSEDIEGVMLLDYEGNRLIARSPEAPVPLSELMQIRRDA